MPETADSGSCALYFLTDPRFPRWPRYVGMTQNVEDRQRKHASLITASTNRRFRDWKEELRALGLSAVLSIHLVFPTREMGRAAEWRLIHRWQRRGLCDCNGKWDGRAEAWMLMCNGRNARRSA